MSSGGTPNWWIPLQRAKVNELQSVLTSPRKVCSGLRIFYPFHQPGLNQHDACIFEDWNTSIS